MRKWTIAWCPVLAMLALAVPTAAPGATKTWIGIGTGDWFTVANWIGGRPDTGDEAVIATAGATVLLTNETPELASLTISSTASLVFSNWTTRLRATEVTVEAGAVLKTAGAFTNAPAMSNRVWIVCSNLTVAAGGAINVDGQGYAQAAGTTSGWGFGPGAGYTYQGGSHGGRGGITPSYFRSYDPQAQGNVYGSVQTPETPGSSGGLVTGDYPGWGGAGGGVVRVQADGTVSVNGTISANGLRGAYDNVVWAASGGAGGSIYVTCRQLDGTGGVVRADGALAYGQASSGGGGRIAVDYNTAAQGAAPVPRVTFSASVAEAGGTSYSSSIIGGWGFFRTGQGSLHFPDNRFLTELVTHRGVWMTPCTEWAVNNLVLSNAWLQMATTGICINIAGNLTISGANATYGAQLNYLEISNGVIDCRGDVRMNNAGMVLSGGGYTGSTLVCGGNLVLTNGANLWVDSGMTNSSREHGARVDVGGAMVVGSNCWVRPGSHYINGGSPFFSVRDLTILAGGGFDATGLGFGGGTNKVSGFGPGKGNSIVSGTSAYYGSGGGYGGMGGYSSLSGGYPVRGGTYGCSNAPVLPGSGGGGGHHFGFPADKCQGGEGGGLVRVLATGTLDLRGAIVANGWDCQQANNRYLYGGGGSGGGVYLQCRRFVGRTGAIVTANGGKGYGAATGAGGGDGGGGRIAIWRVTDASTGAVTTEAKRGDHGRVDCLGADGTIVWGQTPGDGTVILLR
ncbi:MAG: hypothetical protein PHR35_10995 [Kiritimatiellae bacterium]|nr:hypothetical protein [Kiritimatiellia bacterium]